MWLLRSLEVRETRLDVEDGRNDLLESSSLSEGRRLPRVIFFIGEPPRRVSGIAEGSRVGLVPPSESVKCCCSVLEYCS